MSRNIGGITFLVGIIGYLSSRIAIEANPLKYWAAMLSNEWSERLIGNLVIFAAKYGLVVALVGIGITVYGYIASTQNQTKQYSSQ